MKQGLPPGVSLLPTSGTYVSMAYRVMLEGSELGRIERAPRDRGGRWGFVGTGVYSGRRVDTDEFAEAISYAISIAKKP